MGVYAPPPAPGVYGRSAPGVLAPGYPVSFPLAWFGFGLSCGERPGGRGEIDSRSPWIP